MLKIGNGIELVDIARIQDTSNHTLDVIVTSEAADSHRTRFDIPSINLSRMTNGAANLFNHNLNAPIGKPLSIDRDVSNGKKIIKSTMQFADTQLARDVEHLVQMRVVNGVSAGYNGTDAKYKEADDGITDIFEARMDEYSLITGQFNSNPDAVIQRFTKDVIDNISTSTLDIVLPKAELLNRISQISMRIDEQDEIIKNYQRMLDDNKKDEISDIITIMLNKY